ncbi:thioredoxin family protein [Thalassotalea crassostreae]|uniref:thioredoxin family protein n=1 Tax=Thalassotalea crassostreae TaxID=1763536 RepID=UPI0008395E54|nr:thioredoxin family protein [Thalassotalea crassostreae]
MIKRTLKFARQTLMTTLLFNAWLFSTLAVAAQLPLYSKVYDEQRDPFKDAKAAIQLANQSNRNVLIEIGGNWCTWCHKIDAFLADNPDIYNALHENFVLLKINVSDSNENEKFMAGLPPVLGYPHMYVSTGKGKMILSKDTAEFLRSGEYSREAWLQFIDQFKAENNQLNLSKAGTKTSAENNTAKNP